MKNTFYLDFPEAIIFDMDGVIIDTKEMVESFWTNKFEQFGMEVPVENFDERFHGRPAQLTVDQEFSFLPETERIALEQEIEEYDSSIDQFNLIPGIHSFLQSSKDAGIPIALVTSALPPKVEIMKKSLSFDPGFITEVTADRIKQGKPNPECYKLALLELGADPANVLVFEDSISGVRAAAGSHSVVIGVNEPHLHEKLLQKGAIHVIRNFESAVIDSVEKSLHFTSD